MHIQFPKKNKDELVSIFNKIVDKSGSVTAKLIIGEEIEYWKPEPTEQPNWVVPMMFAEVVIPECNGWHVIAKLEDDAGCGKNIVKAINTEVAVPEKYWAGSDCDHCNINRFRKESYLLLKDGEFKQVGSSCIKEFTGGAFNSIFFKMLGGLGETLDDWKSGCGRSRPDGAMTEELLSVTELVLSVYGWVPSSAASENNPSTSSRVYDYLFPSPVRKQDQKLIDKENAKESTATSQSVLNALAWARGMTNEEINGNQYCHNLNVAAQNKFTHTKNFGIMCSLIPAYEKMEARRAPKKDKRVSEYVGKIKERKTFILFYKKMFSYEGDYGTSFTHIFEDADGNAFKWKTGNSMGDDIDYGDSISLKGTIKAHEEYTFKGTGEIVKQTVITRCSDVALLVKAEKLFDSFIYE